MQFKITHKIYLITIILIIVVLYLSSKDVLQTIDNDDFRNTVDAIFHSDTQAKIKKYRLRLQEEILKMRLLSKIRAVTGSSSDCKCTREGQGEIFI